MNDSARNIAQHVFPENNAAHPKKRRPKWTDKRLNSLKRKWFFIGLGIGMMLSGVIVLAAK